MAINASQPMTYGESLKQEIFNFFAHAPEEFKLQMMRQQAPIMGMGFQERIRAEFPSIAPLYYEFLLKTEQLLKRAQNTGNANTQAHYKFLLRMIRDAMKVK